MTLTKVASDSTAIQHLSAVQVKHSGVHIGGGTYLTANHFPAPGGSGTARPQLGLDGESPGRPTSEIDFTMPAGGDWGDYLMPPPEDGSAPPVMPGYDMALHYDQSGVWYDGPAATILVFADPEDYFGHSVSVVGFPVTPPDGGPRAMWEDSGTIIEAIDYDVAGDGSRALVVYDIEVTAGMSVGGGYISWQNPDGVTATCLVGTVARTGVIEAEDGTETPAALLAEIGGVYHDLAAALETMPADSLRSADDFQRQVLVAGQREGSAFTTVQGSFFHEDIWGGVNDDHLSGGGGDDYLNGGAGNDTLVAGSGDNVLTGGSGADLFTGWGGGANTITDFEAASDVLDLSAFFEDMDAVIAATESVAGGIRIDLSQASLSGLGGSVTLAGLSVEDLNALNTRVFCFDAATLIDTAEGPRPAASLRPGTWLRNWEGRLVRLIWAGHSRFCAAQARRHPARQVVSIAPGALGPGIPARELRVTPQHRIMVDSPVVERMTGRRRAFVKAGHLAGLDGVSIRVAAAHWVHLLCEDHQILRAEMAPAESLLPGPMALAGQGEAARDLRGFLDRAGGDYRPALPCLGRTRTAQLLRRHRANAKPLCVALAPA